MLCPALPRTLHKKWVSHLTQSSESTSGSGSSSQAVTEPCKPQLQSWPCHGAAAPRPTPPGPLHHLPTAGTAAPFNAFPASISYFFQSPFHHPPGQGRDAAAMLCSVTTSRQREAVLLRPSAAPAPLQSAAPAPRGFFTG